MLLEHTTFSCDGSDVFRVSVSRRETADPTGLHTAACPGVKSRASQTVLPAESHGLILHPTGNCERKCREVFITIT